ncbi:MAG: formate--tetrahydrofolate ligase [Acidimicrobiia bacterium]
MKKTDIEIALSQDLEPITDIAEKVGLNRDEIYLYGDHIAKIKLSAREGREATARTVLVTAMTPTRAGEGKTTCAIGLNDGLNRIGKRSIVTLREPSLGPVFGMKGGAAGGGFSQVLPMVDINLHFTGDMHAVTSAHNLLAALLDNEYSRPRGAFLLPKNVIWNRVIDMNDRALRSIVLGLGKAAGQVREGMFEITAASEIMAVLGLSRDLDNLKARLGNLIVAKSSNGDPVRARDIEAQGAMAILLRNALKSNLVQTIEGNPAIVHTGPFANIAHGTTSIVAVDTARRLADIVVVEAGFGSDLGAEKYFNLVSRRPGMVPPDVVVVVATIRALRHHGGVPVKDLNDPNPEAVATGMDNLRKHVENMKSFNRPVVIALNRFEGDSREEVDRVVEFAREDGTEIAVCDVWNEGGEGALELAQMVWDASQEEHGDVRYVYDLDEPLEDKIEKVVTRIYGGEQANFLRSAKRDMDQIRNWGYTDIPVCMAKTQASLSDNPRLRNRPTGFSVEIRNVKMCGGAGFAVVYTTDIMTMPGLPSTPAAAAMDIDNEGTVSGLF